MVTANLQIGLSSKHIEAEFHIYSGTKTSEGGYNFTQGSETRKPSDEIAAEVKKQLEKHFPGATVIQDVNTFSVSNQGLSGGAIAGKFEINLLLVMIFTFCL